MIDSIPAETEAEKARVAKFREMTPEKIAPLAVYLASDSADGISGQILSVRRNEIYLVQSEPADPHFAALRRLDAGKNRSPTQGRVRFVVHAA